MDHYSNPMLLEALQETKTELQDRIKQLYKDLLDVGPLRAGEYKLAIRNLEKMLSEIDEKIAGALKTAIPALKEPVDNLKVIVIFLASSAELKQDRDQFEIFINRENNNLVERNIFIRLVIWEDFIDAVAATRLQDNYNAAIRNCDIFLSLFYTKTGRYTEEEFDMALENFKNTGKPIVYTYFKNTDSKISQVAEPSLLAFKDKLGTMGHFPTSYNDIYDLKYQFKMQLEKLDLEKL